MKADIRIKLKKEEYCAEFREDLKQALGGREKLPDDWESTAELAAKKVFILWTEERAQTDLVAE